MAEKTIKDVLTEASLSLWSAYCDKKMEAEQLRDALKKFGQHPTGDIEGAGRCAGFSRAAPFREDLCDCGLNAALSKGHEDG